MTSACLRSSPQCGDRRGYEPISEHDSLVPGVQNDTQREAVTEAVAKVGKVSCVAPGAG